jgi:hypothetical protein
MLRVHASGLVDEHERVRTQRFSIRRSVVA